MTTDDINEPSGTELRDAAIERVLSADEAVHRCHRNEVERILADLIERGEEFTADTINRAIPDDVRDHASPYLTPAVLRVASQAGRIQVVGYAISERPTRHKGILRVWRGVQANEEAA